MKYIGTWKEWKEIGMYLLCIIVSGIGSFVYETRMMFTSISKIFRRMREWWERNFGEEEDEGFFK